MNRIEGNSMIDKVYLLCIVDFDYTNIFGVYTDIKKLYKDYKTLVGQDERCIREKFKQMPTIYELNLNEFTGCMYDWSDCFLDDCPGREVDINVLFENAGI